MEALEADTYRPSCPPEFILINFTWPLLSVIQLCWEDLKKKKRTFIYFLLQIFKWFNSSGTPHNISENLFFFLMHWEKKHITLFSFLKIFGQIYVTWRFTPRTTSLQCLDTETIRYKRWGMVWLNLVMKFVIAHSSVMIKFRI